MNGWIESLFLACCIAGPAWLVVFVRRRKSNKEITEQEPQ
jgi:hypothetical protein